MEIDRNQAGRAASNAVSSAKHQVRELANAGREEVAGQLDGVARALKSAGDHLQEEQSSAGEYTQLAGEKLERAAQYLREHDALDLVNQVEDFARAHPLWFLGGCAAVGFAVGRFFKSTAAESTDFEVEGYETEALPLGTTGDSYGSYGVYDTRVSGVPRAPEPEISGGPGSSGLGMGPGGMSSSGSSGMGSGMGSSGSSGTGPVVTRPAPTPVADTFPMPPRRNNGNGG